MAVPDRDSVSEPELDLVLKQDGLDFLVVKVHAFLVVHEDHTSEVVRVVAVLSQHLVALLAFQGLNEEQGWGLMEAVLVSKILVRLLDALKVVLEF